MKNKEIQRPRNMSQLDYLWTTYGSYKVSNEVDTENDSIPTSSAIRNYITSIGEGITELDSEEIDGYKIKIIGKNPSGQEVSSIQIDSDTKISSFLRHVATQTDVDNGLANYVGEHWLVLKTNTGMEYWASVDDLFIRGQESDTIINQTEDGKISSSVKINNPIINKSVDLKTSTSGLWADLVINPNTKSRTIIVKGDNGIECKFNWEGTETPVALKSFDTFDEYQLTTIDPGTIYLVKDVKSIYFGGIKYSSVGIDPQDYYTKDEVYNKEQVDALPHVNAYSKSETDALLNKKADIDDIPTALPNPNALVVKYNGEIAFTYDGSRAETGNFIVNADTVPGIDEKVKSISYTKEEVDSMITPHTNAYTKEESDAKYATKATTYTKEETYSKQEVDVLVSNPIDAYTKTESDQKYATKSELETKQNALVSGTNIKTFNGQSILGTGNIEFEQGKTITVVTELPQTGDPDRIYLVPNESSRTNDIYDEYIWLVEQSKWEFLGNKHVDVDLTDYYTKEEVDALIPQVDSYTKVESDNKYAVKADVYTKSEVDDLIVPQVDAYTKQESDSKYATIETVNNKVDKVVGKQLSTEDYTTEEKEKLAELSNYDDTNITQKLNEKVDKITGKGLSTEDYTTSEKTKLGTIEEGAQVNTVTSVAGRTGAVTLTKTDIGLDNVDNTSDDDKPISTATQTALDSKVDKVEGKDLSQEDFTTELKSKLDGLSNYDDSTITETLSNKVDKISGKGLSTNDYTTEEKAKLEGIEENANNYTHPTTAGNKHIPSGGTTGQMLVNTEDGTAEWADVSSKLQEKFDLLNTMWQQLQEEQTNLQNEIESMVVNEDVYSYGVEWDVTVADPALTRIGNPLLHKQLPIQSSFRGCVAEGPIIKYWLNPNDWSLKENGEPSVLDGTDGTVRVNTIKFYGKPGSKSNKRWVKISTVKIDDTWVEIPELLIDAYRCTVDTTTSSTPKAVSVVNTTAQFRGGGNRADRDTYLESDAFRTDLGKPRTNTTRANMRTYATNAGSELLCYEYYKWIFYWCWVIEYATFNSQAAYNAELTSEGYHQGGLGDGVTTWDGTSWNNYNGYYPLTPCGYGNDIGNFTGIKDLVIPDTTVSDSITVATKTFKMPRWRGFDNPFGDIWTNLEGIVIKRNAANEDSNVYTTIDPEEFTDEIGSKSVAGIEVAKDGYIKAFDLGRTGEIIPSEVGGSTTTYMCDYHWCNSGNTALRTLLVGGHAYDGASSGLGYFNSNDGVGSAYANVGFRTIIRLN
jgi:hypothetical protein